MIGSLIFAKNLTLQILSANETAPAGCAVSAINEDINVYLMVRGMVDIDAEVGKLQDKLNKVLTMRDALKEKTLVADYEAKVRAEIRQVNDDKVRYIEPV